jgi:Cft2 family RNA processing exonuclease
MKFTALGGGTEVGASCYLLEIAGKNILLDAGIRVNRRGEEALPDLGLLRDLTDGKLDLILISHAHLDHCGALPILHELYPVTPIYATSPTKLIAAILLQDTVKIMEREAEDVDSEAQLYTLDMVKSAIWAIQTVPGARWIKPFDDPEYEFYLHPAGHVMGAASILLKTPEADVIYSGDIATVSQRTVSGMEPINFFHPDLLILESTYGDSKHEARKAEEQKLAKSVAEVIEGGGTVLIPAFAFGRAQEIILILKFSILSGVIPKFPIYVDGLVRAICDLYTELIDFLPARLQNFIANSRQPVFWSAEARGMPRVAKILSHEERQQLLLPEPKCIISSSGMLTGGPSVYYAKWLASNSRNAIFLTGYQDEEAPGRRLQELEQGGVIELDGQEVEVKCRVNKYNLSAHADQVQLCQQVSYIKPRSIVLVHGEPSSIKELREKLVLKSLVFVAPNGKTIDPLQPPDWLTEHRLLQIDAEHNRFFGTIEYTDDGGVAIKFESDLVESPQWRQFFNGYDEVRAKFFGKRLEIRAKLPSDEEEDEGDEE